MHVKLCSVTTAVDTHTHTLVPVCVIKTDMAKRQAGRQTDSQTERHAQTDRWT